MPVGLEITGSSGSVQIDANFQNPMLVAKGTLTLTPTDPPSGWYKTVTYAGNNPMIAFGGVTDTWGVMCFGRSYSNGVWTFGIKGGKQSASGNCSLTYYIFDVDPPGALNYGVQVFKSDGSLAFDGGRGCMKVYGIYSLTEASPSTTLPVGSYAVLQTYSRYFFGQISGSQSMTFGFGVKVSSSDLKIALVPVSGIIPAVWNTTPRPSPPPMVVLDVSNM